MAHAQLLKEQQEAIEDSFGTALDWHPNDKNGQVRITEEAAFEDNEDWPRQHEWLADTLERFDKVFRPLVKDLDAADWPHTDDE